MITLVHGGQTGVDRGAHEAALDNGWLIAGFMPRDGRDERGPIPMDVARYLIPHDKAGYPARTEANVRMCDVLLIIVPDAKNPASTPGTKMTIELAERFRKRKMAVDPNSSVRSIAEWIWLELFARQTLKLPFISQDQDQLPSRLMVAGPRESKWPGACTIAVEILRKIATGLQQIDGGRRSGM